MKVAVVYNRDRKGVINVFGAQNWEWYPETTIQKVAAALKKAGHTVELIPADRQLLSKLKKFLPKLSKRRQPGIVFNLALGIQGKCRYTHVPAILEVAGIPYTGSSPLGHILALDKVVAKQIFMAANLPTPNYMVLNSTDQSALHLQFPIIVKPRSEAASFGLTVVSNEKDLKKAVASILETYKQPALAEEYIEGREINVGIIGNDEPQAFPVLEVALNDSNQKIYTYDCKFARSHKRIRKICPAKLPRETAAYAQKVAIQAYRALNIYDFGRIDIRLDKYNQPFLLELNSMASINPHSSFVYAAKKAGYSYDELVNTILDVAVERYASDEPEIFRNGNHDTCHITHA
jgi:D-alanine-D-alanine ligase